MITIQTECADRKEMVRKLSDFLSIPAVYMRTPTYAFQIGKLTVNRNIEISAHNNAHERNEAFNVAVNKNNNRRIFGIDTVGNGRAYRLCKVVKFTVCYAVFTVGKYLLFRIKRSAAVKIIQNICQHKYTSYKYFEIH